MAMEEEEEEALSRLVLKTAGPLSLALPIQVTRTSSEGSKKPGRKEHLRGQLLNF